MNADPSLPPPPLTPSTSMAYKGVVSSSLSQVKNILLVLSGKGGVGKSTVTTQLALSLFHHVSEPHIGVLDIDLCGPSLPKMFGVHASKVYQSNAGKWVPVIVPGSQNRLKIMSMGVLLPHPDDAVVWRGPKKNAMIRQFLEEVHWGTCEYLIIDTPPGTSDEHIALIETLKEVTRKAAILVTTPQRISTLDVMKEITFCQKVKLPVIGILENMSGFQCPHCQTCTHVFSKDGGRELAHQYHLPFLGSLPIDPRVGPFLESNHVPPWSLTHTYLHLPSTESMHLIRDQVVSFFETMSMENETS